MSPSPIARIETASAVAVIAASSAPVLFLDHEFKVIAASASFCNAEEWDMPQVNALLNATATGYAQVEAYEIDLRRPGEPTRHLVVNGYRGDREHVRLPMQSACKAQSDEARGYLKGARHRVLSIAEVQRQLAASIAMGDANPGTAVSFTHAPQLTAAKAAEKVA
jgi:hypothetical protein